MPSGSSGLISLVFSKFCQNFQFWENFENTSEILNCPRACAITWTNHDVNGKSKTGKIKLLTVFFQPLLKPEYLHKLRIGEYFLPPQQGFGPGGVLRVGGG